MIRRTVLLLCAALAASVALPAAGDAASRPHNAAAPKVKGPAVQGATLRATRGAWWPRPARYRFAWLSCNRHGRRCAALKRAHSRRYRVRARDVGHRLRVRVTAIRHGLKGRRRSAATRVIRRAAPGSEGGTGSGGGTIPGGSGGGAGGGGPSAPAGSGLHVAGNELRNASGARVQLHGVNKSGSEYACVQGWGFWDGPADDASVVAMKAWNINSVRIPLNEQCWLGINGVDPQYGGANYRRAITDFVALLHKHGIYAELSLMWAAPGSQQATYQPEAPNADHSPEFWASLASTFKGDPNVILAPWGEPTVGASCLLEGGCQANFNDTTYTTAGMQEAVDVMRRAGYNGVISIPGLDYANNMTQWLSHKPRDPLGQLVAEAHLYGKNTCDSVSCLNEEYAPVAAQVPLILGETGETYDDSDTGTAYIDRFLTWADAHGVGYEAWTWTVWGTIGSLISNDDGTPNGAYGNYVKNHYATRP